MTATSANRAPRPSSLADVLDVVLDKRVVVDAYVRVALLGIELVTIDARRHRQRRHVPALRAGGGPA